MATTVTYKSATLTTATNETKVLKTAGKYMEDNVTITDSTIVPSGIYTVSASGSADITNYATLSVPSAGKITSYYYHDFTNEMGVNDDTGQVSFFTEGTGNLLHCQSSGWVDSGEILNSEFDYEVFGTKQLPTQAATTITPTESTQTAVAKGKFTTGAVTVAGISSTYVGTGVTRRSSSNMTASGATVTAPAGYYSQNASKTISNATLSSPSITYDDELLYIVTRASTAGYVASGAIGTSVVNITTVNSLPTKAAQTYTPTTTNQTIAAQQWLTGAQTIQGDANLVASNIKSGVSIFGVAGTCSPGGGSYTVGIGFEDKDDPNEYYEEKYYTVSDDSFFTFKQEYLSVTPSSQAQTFNATNPFSTGSHAGYYEVYVAGDANLVSGNIKSGVSIFGVSGSSTVFDTSNATISRPNPQLPVSPQVLNGYTAYGSTGLLSGSMPNRGTLNATISSKTDSVTISQGYYSASTVSIDSTEQAKIISGNIKSGVTILGVSGSSNVIDTTVSLQMLPAVASNILYNRKAYVNGVALTGTMSIAGSGDLFEISTKAGTVNLDGYYQDSAVQIDSAEQAKIIAGNIRSGVTILGVSGDSNVVNTSAGTASSADILSGKIAFVDGAQKTGTMTSNAATTTSITTKAQSVTIPAGYHTGSGKVQIDSTEQGKIIAGNIKSGISILGVTGTYTGSGSSGLEYETGTYEPYNDESHPTVSFSKTHTTIPRIICMQKTSGAGQSSSNYGWLFYNFDAVNTAGVSYNGSTAYHGQVQWTYRSNSTSITSGGRAITYGQASSGANTSTYMRYWATESNFKPYSASTTRYWRSTDTFTWYAIW